MEELVGEGEVCSQLCRDLMPVAIQFALGRHSVSCWLLVGRLQRTVVSVLKSKILPLHLDSSAPSVGPGELVQGWTGPAQCLSGACEKAPELPAPCSWDIHLLALQLKGNFSCTRRLVLRGSVGCCHGKNLTIP